MKDTNSAAQALFADARQRIILDMAAREIGAIVWQIDSASFHFIPAVITGEKGDKDTVARITGLYAYKDTLYFIKEEKGRNLAKEIAKDNFGDTPTVVTLTEHAAVETFGDPAARPQEFLTQATDEELTAIADCYFEALALDNPAQ